MKNHFYAAYKSDMNIAVFKTIEERDELLVEHCLQPALSGECVGWIVL